MAHFHLSLDEHNSNGRSVKLMTAHNDCKNEANAIFVYKVIIRRCIPAVDRPTRRPAPSTGLVVATALRLACRFDAMSSLVARFHSLARVVYVNDPDDLIQHLNNIHQINFKLWFIIIYLHKYTRRKTSATVNSHAIIITWYVIIVTNLQCITKVTKVQPWHCDL